MHINNLTETHFLNANDVFPVLRKHILADGFDFVLDIKNSHGRYLVEERTGTEYLDFFSFFASSALGMNHPKLNTPEFREKLAWAALNKPSNSDVYTVNKAELVDTISNYAMPDHFKYLFFVEGGAVAVENGLKVAFDWKVRKNFRKGYKEEKGHQVLHFREAFHGRTGYTMSLTNTDPNKVNLFPKFNWPRVSNPKITFPLENNLEAVIKAEEQSINEIYAAIKANRDDIAVIIIEPIQAEGGDNHFRKEFLMKLREIADENDIMLMFDEVQTGLGLTGKMWAAEHFVMPDILSFGKKMQVCGIMVSDRVNEEPDNVFKVSSRINSTWGGNFTDMVRAAKIIEVIHEDGLVERSAEMGEVLLNELYDMQREFPTKISNVRGKGLMCAFDMQDKETRNEFISKCWKEKLIILSCGERSVRFRTPLTIEKDELLKGCKIIREVLNSQVK
ncbi:MAG: L-lysine 6-transaminase [Ignavibacteriales bacterium]|nr:MAG: L-lysine 6-transaminase [Ignavibacteriaceae bacterium]MBW7872292.1 L-lysine 6-transaminase [Ignavibacteria bacterium]MCZ2142574.1 L-lysine 6-transaminase [Ignavibacteriales bacterium]OQY78140.1 MAG: L-lysine 6-transaminase [Ignavibacteriales bacterium UTCHB3]MBV6445561.1 putative L-lysine-epsilon aminotransferase [Ignavibacteriaceae bacterium]